MSKKKYILPIFIPHKGCPHDCSFCNQKRIAGQIEEVTGEEVSKMISSYLGTLPATSEEPYCEVAFYGGSFTGLEKGKQIELLEPAFERKNAGVVDEIRVSTRPDYINEENLKLLKKHGVSIIELGVQSTDDEVLKLNNRGHTRAQIVEATHLIKKYTFQLGLQMMVGLYGDSEKTIFNTVKDIVELNPDFVRVYPTVVIKDTYLEKLYLKGIYRPLGLEECIQFCKIILMKFNQHNIPVIRVGLQSTEEIAFGKSVKAGPYHPAFRELVETEIFKDYIEEKIISQNVKEKDEITIYCNPGEASKVAGYKKSNKNYFLKKYHLAGIEIKACRNMRRREIIVEIN